MANILASSMKTLPCAWSLCRRQNLTFVTGKCVPLWIYGTSYFVRRPVRHFQIVVGPRQSSQKLERKSGEVVTPSQRYFWHHLEYSSPVGKRPFMISAGINTDPKELSSAVYISWNDGSRSIYPFVYLRDCCTCHLCYHADANQRLGDIVNVIDIDQDCLVNVKNVSLLQESQAVEVEWEDGHKSSFDARWLWERRLPGETTVGQTHQSSQKHLWGSEILQSMPQIDFHDIMTSDRSTFFFLNCLKQVGFVIIKNSPVLPDVLQDISKRLHIHVRRTHYGEIFQVKSSPNPNSLAYTSDSIPFHVDLAYYKHHPGVQFLHCIEQTKDPEGGWSILADGFHIADRIRKTKPETYEFLTKRKFIFKDIGKDVYGTFKKELARPVIEVDEDGEPCHIAFNNFTRSSFFKESAKRVQEAYRAYYEWEKEVRKPENSIKFKMVPGDILCMDNIRLLHGRTGFDVQVSPRWLQGCYFDWDEINSSFAVFHDIVAQSDVTSS